MKKIFLFWIVSLLLLAGCETDSDEWKNENYTGFSISFVNVPNQNYRVTFNGVEVTSQGRGFVPMDDLTGEIEVYEKESNTLEMKATVTVVPGEPIQLIKLPGKSMAFYDEESYTTVTLNVFYLSGKENLYTTYFGEQELSKGMNYISKDDLTGTLEVYEDEEEVPVFVQEDITFDPEGMVNILQLSDTEFLYLEGGGDEEAPESDDFTKARVFYTPNNTLTEDSYTMKVYAVNEWYYDMEGAVLIDEIEIRSGELSSYVLMDMRSYQHEESPAGITFDLYTQSGEMLVDHLSAFNVLWIDSKDYSGDDLFKAKYKFQTFRLIGSEGEFAFGEEW